jgi:hypothetical protein
MEAVAAKGHNLTVISVDHEKNVPKNMHYIHLDKVYSFIYDDSDEPLNLIEMANGGPISELIDYYKFGTITLEGRLYLLKDYLQKIDESGKKREIRLLSVIKLTHTIYSSVKVR